MRLALAAALVLAGCATAPVRTPAQAIYALEGGYGAALSVAVQYKNLPPCPGPALCSDAAVVSNLQVADRVAFASIKAAEAAARTGASPQTVQALADAALADLAAFQGQVVVLKVK